jgi:hypothetical protein
MPKKRWSASDDRKYKSIVKSCRLAQGRKKGAAKFCKRMAAATVERDRGLDAVPARGMGAQALSLRLGGLRGPWQAGSRVLQTNAEFQQKRGRTAIISNADDPDLSPSDGEVTLAFYEGRVLEGDDLRLIGSADLPDIDTAKATARAVGFDGLAGCACSDTTGLSGRKRRRRK